MDQALTAAVGAITVIGVATELAATVRPHPPAPWAYALALAASAPLVARRRAPLLAALAGLAASLAYNAAGYPGLAPALPLFAACYSITAYGRSPWSLATGMAVVGAASLIPTLPPHPMPWTSFPVLGPSAAMAWMAVLGSAARSRRLAADERVEHARAEAARRLAEDRLAVAREVHDVLAHTIATITVQSGLALDALDSDPEQARAAMQAVRAAAKKARPQVRAALELLRGGEGVAPQPGLDRLAELADQARRAGLRVRLSLPPPDAPVPPLLQLTAYRVVQEALTNVIRHAGAAEVRVGIGVEDGALVVDVADDGTERGSGPGGGFGLAGMRERVTSVGGTLTAGPAGAGGFRVHARLPLEEAG